MEPNLLCDNDGRGCWYEFFKEDRGRICISNNEHLLTNDEAKRQNVRCETKYSTLHQ